MSGRQVGNAVVTAGYEDVPCRDGGLVPTPIKPNRVLTVQLIGNSPATPRSSVASVILQARNAKIEGLEHAGFLMCHGDSRRPRRGEKRARVHRPRSCSRSSPYDRRCGEPWYWPVNRLVAMWKSIGTHVYLVPSVPLVPGNPNENLNGGPLLEAEYYQQLADADPADVTLLDVGTFLRDADGVYGWRMPCVNGGEPGCDAQNTVGVRWTDGFHFCTNIAFATEGCLVVEDQAGERRAAVAVAQRAHPVARSAEDSSERPPGLIRRRVRSCAAAPSSTGSDRFRSTRRARRPEEKALAELAADRAQPVELLGLLDAFGDGLEPERVRQAHDRGGDRGAVGASTDALDERAVDLERLDREAA